jgi:hypothetical protein
LRKSKIQCACFADPYLDSGRPDGAQRLLAQWDGVVAKGTVELLVQQHPFLPEAWLAAGEIRHDDRTVDEAAAPHDASSLWPAAS